MISVQEVTKRFRVCEVDGGVTTFTALDNVGFEARNGEFVSLLGASGCGKTTLLRIIAGLVQADSGEVLVGNSAVQAPRRDLCMVFQNFGLLPWRTVMNNVAFPLELDGVPRKEREALSQECIELVGLKSFEHRYPHELSGGMQQRVGIARALIRKPLVLLMDEPFAALDAQTRENLQEDFMEISKRLAMTVLLVTHSIDEALVMSDRIIVLSTRPGRVRDIIDLPFGSYEERTDMDVRAHPNFPKYRHDIRDMLKGVNAQ